MTSDNNQLPQPVAPAPPEVEAEPVGTALRVQDSPPAEPPPPAAAGRSAGLILLGVFAAVLAIVSAAYFSKDRRPEAPAATAGDNAPAPVTIELPATGRQAIGGAHDGPGPANPSAGKILNDAASFKEDLGETDPAAAEGFINELPPVPHGTPGGGANNALRDAAKRALQDDGPIAPQTEEPEAAFEADDARALAELEMQARRALAFSALAAKARTGAPYEKELKVFLAERQERPLPALIADRAVAGAPTAAALLASFDLYQRKALAAGRREEAVGSGARIGASFVSFFNLRPAGAIRGKDAAAILSRVEAQLRAGDLEAALVEAGALRPEAAGALAPWTREADARAALDAALAERERSLLAGLSGGRP